MRISQFLCLLAVSLGVVREATAQAVSPGIYRVEVEKPGFKKFVSDNAELRVGAVLRIDGVLEIGAVTDTVEVMAQSPLLQTDTAEISRTFIPRTITELPLVNRSFQGLAGILPGITPPSEDSLNLEDPQGTTFFGSEQEFVKHRILGRFLENHEFSFGGCHALGFQQQVREILVAAAAA